MGDAVMRRLDNACSSTASVAMEGARDVRKVLSAMASQSEEVVMDEMETEWRYISWRCGP